MKKSKLKEIIAEKNRTIKLLNDRLEQVVLFPTSDISVLITEEIKFRNSIDKCYENILTGGKND